MAMALLADAAALRYRPAMPPEPSPVPEYASVDRARFEGEIAPLGRPAVLRGLVADWPAVRAARNGADALAAYLKPFAAGGTIETWLGLPEIEGRFGYAPDFRGFNHERRAATFAQLVELVLRQRGSPRPVSVYAGGAPIPKHLPGLEAELPMPLLEQGRERLVSLWFGNRTKTATHWDLPQNLACVVAGRRRFTLFPTDQIANLYVGPVDFTPAGQPISLVDADAPDLALFPRFAEALAHAETAVLEPGDALYLPSLWWHAVESLDEVGAMVNFWWRDGPAWLDTPLFTLLHAALTMKDLPERERAAWRHFFDHYIFRDTGDPMAHLPAEARGVFGETTPESLARLKGILRKSLEP